MAIEAPERTKFPRQDQKPRSEDKPRVQKTKKSLRSRVLPYVLTGVLTLPGATALVDFAKKFNGSSEVSNSLSIENQVNSKTYPLPADYKHDFVLPPIEEFAATDAGASVELSPGIFLVTYSDTFQGKLGAINLHGEQKILRGSERMTNNCAVIFDENTGQYTVLTGPKDKLGSDTSWISPKENDGSYYWTQTPIVENGKLYITLAHNKPHTNDMWWDYLGTHIAVFDLSTGLPIPDKNQPIIELPRIESDTHITTWGAAILQDGKKEFTYIYGSSEPKQNNPYHTKELRVARVPYGQIADLSKWQFLGKKGWNSTNPHATGEQIQENWKNAEKTAKPIIDYTQGISAGFSVNFIDGKVVLTTKDTDILGDKVLAFTGSSPEGPFKKHTIIDSVSKLIPADHRPANGKIWTYLAYLHPEVKDPENRNRILVTISTMPDTDNPREDILNNVNTYKPFSVWVDRNTLFN